MLLAPQRKSIFRRHRVLWIWGVITAVGALAVLVVALAGVIAVGGAGLAGYAGVLIFEQPVACTMCHNMRPAYESWKMSTHEGIICAECHNEPGTIGTLKGTILAPIRESFLYLTRTYGNKPLIVDIQDDSCMREHCHKSRLLHGEVFFKRVVFDHAEHLAPLLDGKQLHCTSCHSQIVVGTHIAVTEQICFICHFKKDSIAKVPSGCSSCHRAPVRPIEFQGMAFDHQHPIVRDRSCEDCHDHISHGEGQVVPELCLKCHEEAQVLERIADSDYLHQHHVVEHTVKCFDCHETVTHEIEDDWRPACSMCHQAEERIYHGIDPLGHSLGASRMRTVADMGCEACHLDAHVEPVSEDVCDVCHGGEPDRTIAGVQEIFDGELSRVQGRRAEIDVRVRGTTDIEQLEFAGAFLHGAVDFLEQLRNDRSRGVHNLRFFRTVTATVDDVFDLAEDELAGRTRQGRRPGSGPAPGPTPRPTPSPTPQPTPMPDAPHEDRGECSDCH